VRAGLDAQARSMAARDTHPAVLLGRIRTESLPSPAIAIWRPSTYPMSNDMDSYMIQLRPIADMPRDLPDPTITDAEGAAMFRAAVTLFRRWQLTDEQAAALLDMPGRTYARWKAGAVGRIGRDGKARLSNLMGIHKALRIVFREPQRGYDWVRAPNAAFAGRSALDVMLGGELTDLMRVRRYLDAERGGW
jgi:uncharacterized protein (DUF2384 family)